MVLRADTYSEPHVDGKDVASGITLTRFRVPFVAITPCTGPVFRHGARCATFVDSPPPWRWRMCQSSSGMNSSVAQEWFATSPLRVEHCFPKLPAALQQHSWLPVSTLSSPASTRNLDRTKKFQCRKVRQVCDGPRSKLSGGVRHDRCSIAGRGSSVLIECCPPQPPLQPLVVMPVVMLLLLASLPPAPHGGGK